MHVLGKCGKKTNFSFKYQEINMQECNENIQFGNYTNLKNLKLLPPFINILICFTLFLIDFFFIYKKVNNYFIKKRNGKKLTKNTVQLIALLNSKIFSLPRYCDSTLRKSTSGLLLGEIRHGNMIRYYNSRFLAKFNNSVRKSYVTLLSCFYFTL